MGMNVAQPPPAQQYTDGDNNGQAATTPFIQGIKLKLNGVDIGVGYGLPITPTGSTVVDHSGTLSGTTAVQVLAANPNRKYLKIGNPSEAGYLAWGIKSNITLNTVTGAGSAGAVPLDPHGTEEFDRTTILTNAIYIVGPSGAAYTVLEG